MGVTGLATNWVGRFAKKGLREKAASIKWWANYLRMSLMVRIVFGIIPWHPRGKMPFYVAYYPECLKRDHSLKGLYSKWTRGNIVNNNGDGARFVSLLLNARKVMEDDVKGDFTELGVWRGNSAAILAKIAEQHGRTLFLFDTFEGFDSRDIKSFDQNRRHGEFQDTSLDYVKQTVENDRSVRYIKGFFPESIPHELENSLFSLVHLDCDLYAPMKAALNFFYPRMSKGAILIMHDYSSGSWPGATQAINEFCSETGEALVILPDKSGTAILRKSQALLP
jgi:hypothetical protein